MIKFTKIKATITLTVRLLKSILDGASLKQNNISCANPETFTKEKFFITAQFGSATRYAYIAILNAIAGDLEGIAIL